MKTLYGATLLFAFSLVPNAAVAEEEVYTNVTIGVMGVDEDADSAKYDEYRDMQDGTFGDVELRAFKKRYYLDFEANRIGRGDESYFLRGGRYGDFRYTLFYDETPHHLSEGAMTFYSGTGTNYLANTGLSADPGRWNGFDYRRDRQTYGFDGDLSFGTPFYVRFGADEKRTDGVMPYFGNSTFVSFGRTTELPAPVDWKETRAFLEGGYRTRALTASVKAEFSDFDNSEEEFFWEDDFATNPAILPDATTLAPDNTFWKLSGQMVWRSPFLSSSLALRATYSEMESNPTIRTIVADDASPGYTQLSLNRDDFDGNVTYASFDAAWKVEPADGLSLETFIKYLDKNNDSSHITFTAGGRTDETEIFDYDKVSAGLEASYALAGRTSLDGGYTFENMNREGRLDNDGSDDNLLYLQVRNRSWERVELRARYEYLNRDGDFNPKDTGDSPTDPEYIRLFVRRFDVADLERQRVELEAATSPADTLGLAAEFGWEDNNYDKTQLGLTAARHYDVYVTADYSGLRMLHAGVYVGYENDESDMDSRRFNPGDIADPAAGTGGAAFNWSEVKTYDTIAYGLSLEVPLGKRLLLSAAWDHQNVDGKADFTSEGAGSLINFEEVEDYTKKELSLDLSYRFTDFLSLTAGYVYEKYDFSDEQWDGYTLLPNSQTLLTGAYADSDYEANMAFLKTTYRF